MLLFTVLCFNFSIRRIRDSLKAVELAKAYVNETVMNRQLALFNSFFVMYLATHVLNDAVVYLAEYHSEDTYTNQLRCQLALSVTLVNFCELFVLVLLLAMILHMTVKYTDLAKNKRLQHRLEAKKNDPLAATAESNFEQYERQRVNRLAEHNARLAEEVMVVIIAQMQQEEEEKNNLRGGSSIEHDPAPEGVTCAINLGGCDLDESVMISDTDQYESSDEDEDDKSCDSDT